MSRDRNRSKTTIISLKDASGRVRQVEIKDFNPIAFARALTTRKEARGGTAKQRLVAKVQDDLRRRGIRV